MPTPIINILAGHSKQTGNINNVDCRHGSLSVLWIPAHMTRRSPVVELQIQHVLLLSRQDSVGVVCQFLIAVIVHHHHWVCFSQQVPGVLSQILTILSNLLQLLQVYLLYMVSLA